MNNFQKGNDGDGNESIYNLVVLEFKVWNAVTVLCGQLDCDDGHL